MLRHAMPPVRSFTCLLALASLAVAGCGEGARASTEGDPIPPRRALPVVGSDISALPRLEAAGAIHSDASGRRDALTALRAAGHRTFRLRLFVEPAGDDVVVNDLPYTLALAERVAASGATLLLALHYSDTWADPAHQTTPAAWRALSLDALEREVERYTADVLRRFRDRGVLPRFVQLGNEIDGGLLWPQGRIGDGTAATATQRAAFGRLLRAAARGVRQVVPSRDSTRVLIHYSQGGDAAGARWFFDQVVAEQVPFDAIAVSYYPWWHGSLDQLRATIEATSARYDRDVLVVETAAPWRGDWFPPAGARGPLAFAATPAGQRAFAEALMATVASTTRGMGVLWWYPEAVPVTGLSVWAGGALGLFDASGRLLPAAGVLR